MRYYVGRVREGCSWHVVSDHGWALCSIIVTLPETRAGSLQDVTCKTCQRYVTTQRLPWAPRMVTDTRDEAPA